MEVRQLRIMKDALIRLVEDRVVNDRMVGVANDELMGDSVVDSMREWSV